jgi:hypothetical protein
MDIPFLLAQAAPPVNNTACNVNQIAGTALSSDAVTNLQNSAAIAQNVSKGWDCQWTNLVVDQGNSVVGPVFTQMAQIGTIFAVATAAWFVLVWAQDLNDNRDPSNAISRLLWPVVVAVFLNNHGYLLGLSAATIRSWVTNIDQKMLTQVSGALTLQQAYQYQMNYQPTENAIQKIMATCASIPASKRDICLYGEAPSQAAQSGQPAPPPQALTAATASPTSAYGKLKALISKYQNQPIGTVLGGYLNSLADGVSKNGVTGLWNALSRGPEAIDIGIKSAASQMAFSNTIEVSMLLTAMIAPLAMGGSLVPKGEPAIFAWCAAMFSVALAKIIYNSIVCIVASVLVNAGGGDSLWFGTFLTDNAPQLTSVLAGGGGVSLFVVFQKFASDKGQQATDTIINVVKTIALIV